MTLRTGRNANKKMNPSMNRPTKLRVNILLTKTPTWFSSLDLIWAMNGIITLSTELAKIPLKNIIIPYAKKNASVAPLIPNHAAIKNGTRNPIDLPALDHRVVTMEARIKEEEKIL